MDANQIFSGVAILVSLITAVGVWKKSGADTTEIYQRLRREAAKDLEEALAKLDLALEKIERQRVEILTLKQQVDILLASDSQKKVRIEVLEAGYKIVVAENRRLEKYVKSLIDEIMRLGGTVPPMPPLEIEGMMKEIK